jgi:hypothetical protein
VQHYAATGGIRDALYPAAEYNEFRHPVTTLCRHSIGCRVSVQNLIRAEDVGGRFELGQNPVFGRLTAHNSLAVDGWVIMT